MAVLSQFLEVPQQTTPTGVMEFSRLPDFADFYRQGSSYRWSRSGPGFCMVLFPADVVGVERIQPDPPASELVMLHPQWCRGCATELAHPRPSSCPACAQPVPSLEDARRALIEWTGADDVRI